MATSVETPGVDLRTRTTQLGAKEKARRKRCEVRFSLIMKNRIFQKSCMRTEVRKLLRTGLVPASVERPSSWKGAHRKAQVDEANAVFGSCLAKFLRISVPLLRWRMLGFLLGFRCVCACCASF